MIFFSVLVIATLAESYKDLVRLYREGHPYEAVRALSVRSLRDFRDARAMTQAWDQRSLEAAALLHTETAFYVWSLEGGKNEARDHIKIARSLIESVDDARFEPRWIVLVAAFFQSEMALEATAQHLDLAYKKYPQDPEVLLALGSLEETLGSPYADPLSLSYNRDDARRQLHRALDFYAKALRASPIWMKRVCEKDASSLNSRATTKLSPS